MLIPHNLLQVLNLPFLGLLLLSGYCTGLQHSTMNTNNQIQFTKVLQKEADYVVKQSKLVDE